MRQPLLSVLSATWVLAVSASVTAQNAQPTPPTRAANGPDAPKWTVVGTQPGSGEPRGAAGMSAPTDRNGDFLIGPDYVPAPELSLAPVFPRGPSSNSRWTRKRVIFIPVSPGIRSVPSWYTMVPSSAIPI